MKDTKHKMMTSDNEKKATNTAFILLFPAVILTAMAALFAPGWAKLLSIALGVYQLLLIKKFIEDYYKYSI